ncbi:MAG: M1 family aminopeptidase [Pyrinomonadaceae bacterium]
MAYKATEKVMPEMNAWKVFYERVKQAAYQTDSTRGTTPIYQEIKNLSAAKSAYGNIVYNKAPAFLRQAEFFLGEDDFNQAVRAFLKKHEYANAGWEDLVKEFEFATNRTKKNDVEDLNDWAANWVEQSGLGEIRFGRFLTNDDKEIGIRFVSHVPLRMESGWEMKFNLLFRYADGTNKIQTHQMRWGDKEIKFSDLNAKQKPVFVFANYQDYGFGIFLLDDKSRDYVLKNVQNETDAFLRSMMLGSLWDSVREGELDPRVYVELAIKQLGGQTGQHSNTVAKAHASARAIENHSKAESDETIIQSLLSRVSLALNYYMSEPPALAGGQKAGRGSTNWPAANAAGSDKNDLRSRVEDVLIERMRNAPSLGQRITYYRAFLNVASSEKARGVLKGMLATDGNLSGSEGASSDAAKRDTLPTGRVSASNAIPLKTKDKFDIVTRLAILGDADAANLLTALEKTETSDDAKRYAYAARAGFGSAENKAKYWNDFVNNKEISESWIEAAFGPWNSIRHNQLTLPYLQKALQELPNHKRNRKIFFVNGWLAAFIGGQRSEEALNIVNKFLADNPSLDNDLRLKILENVDLIERAVKIRKKWNH